ncbi:YheC/YheD family endospore coat-associated protein [Bacillus sp. EB01]|uniref:YheC/YheD family endospore coat-associated protein n=1 Tax=Bacillus sp. EB01 TaxID=1347086 RepID=UPI0005C66BBB|nr:YheC/YheD family protein [Bacillus sp. EB01]
MARRYPIKALEDDKPIIYYPEAFKLPPTLKKAAFGKSAVEVAFSQNPNHTKEFALTKPVSKALCISDFDFELKPYFNEETLYMGPLVGIFTTGLLESSVKPAGDRSDYFAKLLESCTSLGAFGYLFTPQSIDWETSTVKGHILHNGKWETRNLPFPAVIYDRVPSRRAEQHPQSRFAKERLVKDYFIPWFNPGFFNKIDIHNRLRESSAARKYLPETVLYSSVSEVRRLLDKYGSVYLKPCDGSRGKGICQVIAELPGSTCYARFRNNQGENKLLKFPNLDALFSEMFSTKKRRNLLVQQRILLTKADGNAVDFRVHTNKDANGQWQVSAIAAKLAGNQSITTHAGYGGQIHTLEELFGDKKAEIEQKLANSALELSHILEQKLDGITGEFGWDLCFDRNGRAWLLEANSKPGRSIFHSSTMRQSEYLTRKLLIEYAIRLAEKSAVAPEEIYL